MASSAHAQLFLRGSDEPLAGRIVSVSGEGVRIEVLATASLQTPAQPLESHAAGVDRVQLFTWDRIRELQGDQASQADGFRPLADGLWRARAREQRGDARGAASALTEIEPIAGILSGASAAVYFNLQVGLRLSAGQEHGAIEAWTRWLSAVSADPLFASPAASNILPTIDPATGLVPRLAPVWLGQPSVEAAVTRLERTATELPPGIGQDMARLYAVAARFELSRRPVDLDEVTTLHSASNRQEPLVMGLALVADMVAARVGTEPVRASARTRLQARLTGEPEPLVEVWSRVALGRSLLLEDSPESKRRGVLQIVHIAARFPTFSPSLTARALAEAAVAMHELGDPDAARIIGSDIERLTPLSVIDTWGPFRTITDLINSAQEPGRASSPAAPAPASGSSTADIAVQTAENTSDGEVESYMQRLGLWSLLVDQLEDRLSASPNDHRGKLAERLARVYVTLLSSETDPDKASKVDLRARALLQRVPEVDSFELRIHLERTLYLKAEQAVERHRLRVADADEIAQAERWLSRLKQQFHDLGNKLNTRVTALEREENSLGSGSPALVAGGSLERIQTDLADARRLRSVAFYLAGWTRVYLATLSPSDTLATEALRDFGWILNAPGQRASVLKVQRSLLQYSHVSRAIVGCALANAMLKQDVEASRWLDLLESEDQIPADVREQLPRWRIIVFASTGRWTEVERTIRLLRRLERPDQPVGTQPLSPVLARLLAVLAIEADARKPGANRPAAKASTHPVVVEELITTALSDLIARREVAQVVDLVKRYGTLPLGEDGFVTRYVRGLYAFDQARQAHAGVPSADSAEPSEDPAVINAYRESASLLESALSQADAASFPLERVRAMMTLARAGFYQSRLQLASDQFQRAYEAASLDPSLASDAEESLWLSVLAIDRAARTSDPSANASSSPVPAVMLRRRAELVAIFLAQFPSSERAPRLILLQASSGALDDESAIKILSGVARESAMYEPARRQLAQLLYNKARKADAQARSFANIQFLAIAEEVLAIDAATARGPATDLARSAAERAIGRSRQIIEVVLAQTPPGLQRAELGLASIDELSRLQRTDLAPIQSELTYRRVQVALAHGDQASAFTHASALAALSDRGGAFGAAADRLLYRPVLAAWAGASPEQRTLSTAQDLLSIGVRLIDRMSAAGDASASGASNRVGIADSVADAAWWIFQTSGDVKARDLAMRLDAMLLADQPRLQRSLRRLGEASAQLGDHRTALRCWNTLAEAEQAGSTEWFQARYFALKSLFVLDQSKARQSLDQHKILYPDFGPGEWGAKLRELDAQTMAPATPNPSSEVPTETAP